MHHQWCLFGSKFGILQTEHITPMALDAVVVQASFSLQTCCGVLGSLKGYPVSPPRSSLPILPGGWQLCLRAGLSVPGASSLTEASPQAVPCSQNTSSPCPSPAQCSQVLHNSFTEAVPHPNLSFVAFLKAVMVIIFAWSMPHVCYAGYPGDFCC